MAIVNAKTDILGINRASVGGPCEVIKDSNGVELKNVLDSWRFMDKDGVQAQLVVLYHPEITLAAGAAAVEGKGYGNFAPGSRIVCANGNAHKDGAAGTDTWTAMLAT